jgi:hypothetical protein
LRAALLAFVLALAPSAVVEAQAPECHAYAGDAGRVCTAAVDASRAVHPFLGILISGGNPGLGTAAALGGLGHVSATARVNAVSVALPKLSYDGASTAVPVGREVFAPAPLVEGAVGLYGGLGAGTLAVDALGSAELLPVGVFDDLRVDPGARRIGDVALGLGFGARVGILRELGPVPALSVSVMRRDLPTIGYGSIANGDEFQYDVDLRATNLRLVASKQFTAFSAAAGLGWDHYTGQAVIRVRSGALPGATPDVSVDLADSRASAFVNAGVELAAVSLVAEAGYLGGRDQNLTTDFQDFDTTRGKFFAGFGMRVGL